MKQLYFSFLALILIGCADTHHLQRPASTNIRLPATSAIYVARPTDGRYQHINYAGSGAKTAMEIRSILFPYFSRVEIGDRTETKSKALETARSAGYDILIYPEILHWEDRATEWSGLPDQISVQVDLVNVEEGRTLDSTAISAKSGLATFGGDKPHHLLRKPFAEYASILVGKKIVIDEPKRPSNQSGFGY